MTVGFDDYALKFEALNKGGKSKLILGSINIWGVIVFL